MKVVFTVLDALPVASRRRATHAGAHRAWRTRRGPPRVRARAVMTAATYPNHATFATGARPQEHGIGTNYVPAHRRLHAGVGARTCGPHALRRVPGRRPSSRAVVGDQCLIGVMGARAADAHWPPNGEIPADARRDAHDYIDDATPSWSCSAPSTRATRSRGVAAQRARHRRARARSRQRCCTGRVPRDRRAARIGRVTTSTGTTPSGSSCPTTIRRPSSIRSRSTSRAAFARRGVDLFALPEGSATVVCGDGALDAARWLPEVDGVEGTAPFHLADPGLDACLAWCVPGRTFGFRELPTEPGTHGGPRTRTQVAVVTGGHPAAAHRCRAHLGTHGERRRLGADDRNAARARAPARQRSLHDLTGRARTARISAPRATRSTAGRQTSSGSTDALRTLAASSARRSASRSARSTRRSNSATSAGVMTPP